MTFKTHQPKTIFPASLLCDFYKVSHMAQYPEGTQKIYSTFTPRSNKYLKQATNVVVFAIQSFTKRYLIDYFNTHFFERPKKEVVAEYARYIKFTLGVESPSTEHIEKLHDLGYLPLKLKALKEGTKAPIKVPVLTLVNTHDDFFWLTNYFETLMSAEIWQPMTAATIAQEYRKLLDEYAIKTTGSTDGVDFQGHDFSLRGMEGLEAGAASGAGHLLSFTGTDTIPAIAYHEAYYNANIEKELIASSIPATEHSVMSASTPADGDRDEYDMYKRLLTQVYPNGYFSVVSDTFDFWRNVSVTIPSLKTEIMSRKGKMVVRPDSGDPVEILCGKNIEEIKLSPEYDTLDYAKSEMEDFIYDFVRKDTPHGECGEEDHTKEFKYKDKYYTMTVEFDWNRYDKQYYYIDDQRITDFKEFTPKASDLGVVESLWNTFGGTITEQGYKVLDSHIGVIYGDSITLDRAREIVERLEEKGFASTNVVLGIGSYTYQYNTRDTLGFAMKATYAVINDQEVMLFKDPKTDDGTKRSQRGMVAVIEKDGQIQYVDGLDQATYDAEYAAIDMLEDVFVDGKLVRDQSLAEIRSILKGK